MARKTRTASVCPQCGASLAPGSTSCQYCGSHFEGPEPSASASGGQTKYCRFCGGIIPIDAVVCTKCGRQVEELKREDASPDPRVVVNNYNVRSRNAPLYAHRSYVPGKKPLSKWTAFFLCLFLGYLGIHKFYEGKVALGIIYLFTFGLIGVGIVVDLIVLLFRPDPYYV